MHTATASPATSTAATSGLQGGRELSLSVAHWRQAQQHTSTSVARLGNWMTRLRAQRHETLSLAGELAGTAAGRGWGGAAQPCEQDAGQVPEQRGPCRSSSDECVGGASRRPMWGRRPRTIAMTHAEALRPSLQHSDRAVRRPEDATVGRGWMCMGMQRPRWEHEEQCDTHQQGPPHRHPLPARNRFRGDARPCDSSPGCAQQGRQRRVGLPHLQQGRQCPPASSCMSEATLSEGCSVRACRASCLREAPTADEGPPAAAPPARRLHQAWCRVGARGTHLAR